MRKILRISPGLIAALTIGVISGCEWENSSDDQFNTSQGGGTEINFSGLYVAHEEGGELIAGSDITRLQITQTGSRLDVVDSNGHTYEGVTGSPGVIDDPLAIADNGTPTYPAGALMSLLQITFWSNGDFEHEDIYFTGYIRFIAVTDISGTESTTDIDINEPPVHTTTSTTTTFSADESNSMMTLEGQWADHGGAISVVDGWSKNYTVSWPSGTQTQN